MASSIDAIKIYNFCTIFCLLMKHSSPPGVGSIIFITYMFAEMKSSCYHSITSASFFCERAGIFEDHLIGRYILPNRLTGQVYLNFLENNLFFWKIFLYNTDNECGSCMIVPLPISSLMSNAI